MEETKSPEDPIVYWMPHPDIASEDFELVRMFDSMIYEDETKDEMMVGIEGQGALSSQQTREVMLATMGANMEKFQASGVGLASNAAGNVPPQMAEPKQKRKPPIAKQVSSKISSASSKLTELMAWRAKVNDCSSLSPNLLQGFVAELDSKKKAIEDAKTTVEDLYAETLGKTDKEINENTDLVQRVTKSMGSVDAAFTSFNGTLKSIKGALEPAKAKAKAPAKAKGAPPPPPGAPAPPS